MSRLGLKLYPKADDWVWEGDTPVRVKEVGGHHAGGKLVGV
jgi:hypothetical protein